MRPTTEIDTLRQQLPYHQLRKVKKEKIVPVDWQTEWERFDAADLGNFDLAAIPAKLLENLQKRQDVLMDGNQAALSVLTRVVDGLCGYPITPSTPIAENFAQAASNGARKTCSAHELMYFQPSDELSAIAAVEAMACQGGRYVDNTSSQGLVLKTKNLFSVPGKRLPVVMTVMAREVNKGSLSIHCGHTDFYAVRNAGWAQLVCQDNQELHDLLPIAFKVSELRQVMLPTMVIGDGFIKSHAIENVRELSDAFLEYFVGPPNRLYQPNFEHGTLTGTFTDTDLTMEGQVAQDLAYRFFKRGFVPGHERHEQDPGHQPQGGGVLPHRRRRHGGGHPGLRRRRGQGRGGLLPGRQGLQDRRGAPGAVQSARATKSWPTACATPR